MAELKLTPAHSGDTECSTFHVKPYVRKHLSVDNDFIEVVRLKKKPSLGSDSSQRLQLHKRRNDTGSRHVPRNPTAEVL